MRRDAFGLLPFLGDEDRESRARMVRHLRDLREPERLSLGEVASRLRVAEKTSEEREFKPGYMAEVRRRIVGPQAEPEVLDFRGPHLTRAVGDKR